MSSKTNSGKMLQKWRDNIGSKTSDVLLDKQFGILQL